MTTYIESTPLPGGTYDHTEVIEAHRKGAKVEMQGERIWIGVEPGFAPLLKYRAQVPDTYGDTVKLDDGGVMMLNYDSPKVQEKIREHFKILKKFPVGKDTYGIHKSSSTLREVKGGAGPAVDEMLLDCIAERDKRIKELESLLGEARDTIEDILGYVVSTGSDDAVLDKIRAALNKEPK